jgi:hypothetical protein
MMAMAMAMLLLSMDDHGSIHGGRGLIPSIPSSSPTCEI